MKDPFFGRKQNGFLSCSTNGRLENGSCFRLAPFFWFDFRKIVLVGMGIDLMLVWGSFVGAHLLRFEGVPSLDVVLRGIYVLPAIGLLKIAVFHWTGLYRGLWAHAGTPEAVQLVRGSSVASGLMVGGLMLTGLTPIPIALLVLDWMLTTILTGARRFGCRGWRQHRSRTGPERQDILIYGADAYGVLLLRYLRRVASDRASVVGFVDPNHSGLQLRGLPVLESPKGMEAEHLIIPVPASSTNEIPSRDCQQLEASYASLGIACHQFALTMDPLRKEVSEEEQQRTIP